MEIISFILGYLVIGFITALIAHKTGAWNPVKIESSYDAVFITFVWPVFCFAWLCMLILWPIAKFYEKLFGL
ncbi:hypothetical protein KIT01_090 [Escherichia phage KIT01]|nr:hypothetical protein KIT01_090 [Escherichia phage KIT01]